MASWQMMIRKFSTSSSVANLIRPPIQVFGVDGRYANALYSAAAREKQLDHVEKDMKTMGEVILTHKRIAETLKSPIVTKQEKRQILQNLAKEYQMSPLTVNVFNAMVDNGRLGLVPKLLKTFATIMSAERGEVLVTVTTAKPLDGAQAKELEGVLKAFAKKGQVLKIESKLDSSILGGMIVSIGDRYVDMSTASKIRMYSKIIEETA